MSCVLNQQAQIFEYLAGYVLLIMNKYGLVVLYCDIEVVCIKSITNFETMRVFHGYVYVSTLY